MEPTFDVNAHITRIGTRLVQEFDGARSATTPTAVGDAMEYPVRRQLEQLLPRGIAVGSGFVIDSYGGTSSQTDVVLYERDICPVFSINDTPETTYYPCEGVIAVGQVKSLLTRNHLKEEFGKIASVKRLRRYPVKNFMPHPTTGAPVISERSYGSLQTPSVLDLSPKSHDDETRQIFGFILAGAISSKPKTLSEAFLEFTDQVGENSSPNMAVVLEGGVLNWGNITKMRRENIWSDERGSWGVRETNDGPERWDRVFSAQKAKGVGYSNDTEGFRALIRWIYEIYRIGKTSDARAFDQYFQKSINRDLGYINFFPKLETESRDGGDEGFPSGDVSNAVR